jgi:hypothetical protein
MISMFSVELGFPFPSRGSFPALDRGNHTINIGLLPVPEFLVLPVSGGSESYLAWLEASLRETGGFFVMLQVFLSPVVPYAAFVRGLRD